MVETRLEELKSTATNVARYAENAKKYSQIDEKISEILRTFIQKVTIGKRNKKHSRNAVQEIKIDYRDLGLLGDVPEADVEEATLMPIHQTTAEVAEKGTWRLRNLSLHAGTVIEFECVH